MMSVGGLQANDEDGTSWDFQVITLEFFVICLLGYSHSYQIKGYSNQNRVEQLNFFIFNVGR